MLKFLMNVINVLNETLEMGDDVKNRYRHLFYS
ncbi:hypothetical protein J2Z37_004451 [Ammoniphilus resinae]|uniref:Uncharacterized protein n=1 Tax=Ammoniphilus resinae TaxID=861532 RepID=A0ABS4GVZ9_9BACL|nr:hypothetical protein [Ammoniphilus resinae]